MGEATFSGLYLFTDDIYYYETDKVTGDAAYFAGGVLESNDNDGGQKTTVQKTSAEVRASLNVDELWRVIGGELEKPVSQKQAGWHYLFFDYNKVFYNQTTEAYFGGVKYRSFVASFHAYKKNKKFVEYEFTVTSTEGACSYSVCDNVSNLNAQNLKTRYDQFVAENGG